MAISLLHPCHFSVNVDANIVELVRSLLQQCVEDQLVRDLCAMPVVSCGQIR